MDRNISYGQMLRSGDTVVVTASVEGNILVYHGRKSGDARSFDYEPL